PVVSRFTNVDWDLVLDFIEDGNTSSIMAMDGFWEYFAQDYSDRPGHLKRTSFPDPISWISASVTEMFPIDCGTQCDSETRECFDICASEEDYCDLSLEEPELTELPIEDYPSIILPLDPSVDARTVSSCGVNVDVPNYVEMDKFGHAQPGIEPMFDVINTKVDVITIQAKKPTVEYFNTGKNPHGYVFLPGTTTNVFGSLHYNCLDCSLGSIEVDVWIAPFNQFYEHPTSKFVVGTVTLPTNLGGGEFVEYLFTVEMESSDINANVSGSSFGNITYQVVGFTATNVEIGGELGITNVVLTDDDMIQACTKIKGDVPLVHPSKRIVDTRPKHRCIFTKADQEALGAAEVGTCYCAPPKGGQRCECFAVHTPTGQQVCGGGGSKSSLLHSPPTDYPQFPTIQTRTNEWGEQGCYRYETLDENGANGETSHKFGCKLRDTGRILRTVNTLQSPYDFPSYVRFDEKPGDDQYILVEDPDEDPPFNFDLATEICLGESSALPSWISALEAQNYVDLANDQLPVYVDLIKHDDTDPQHPNYNLEWVTRNRVLVECETEAACGTLFDMDCEGTARQNNICVAINHNNVAFRDVFMYGAFGGGPYTAASDGIMAPVAYPLHPLELTLNWVLRYGDQQVTIVIWARSTDSFSGSQAFFVKGLEEDFATEVGCVMSSLDVEGPRFEFECDSPMSYVVIDRPDYAGRLSTTDFYEVQALNSATRTPFFDYS
ncbi:MAG: hypothetical protein ACTSUE_07205, partial [Promethearchaeota archaeon]